jgi:hypothetical protein
MPNQHELMLAEVGIRNRNEIDNAERYFDEFEANAFSQPQTCRVISIT